MVTIVLREFYLSTDLDIYIINLDIAVFNGCYNLILEIQIITELKEIYIQIMNTYNFIIITNL